WKKCRGKPAFPAITCIALSKGSFDSLLTLTSQVSGSSVRAPCSKTAMPSRMRRWSLASRASRPSAGYFARDMASLLRQSLKFARLGKRKRDDAAYAAVMKISLIALGVSDLSKSVAFYRDKAGFYLQNQFESFAFFSAGPVMLMLNSGLRRPECPLAGAM